MIDESNEDAMARQMVMGVAPVIAEAAGSVAEEALPEHPENATGTRLFPNAVLPVNVEEHDVSVALMYTAALLRSDPVAGIESVELTSDPTELLVPRA